MSKYKLIINYRCGHTKEYKVDEKPDPACRYLSTDCESCRRKANEKAITIKELNEIKVKLDGTEKQVRYAEIYRDKFIRYWVRTAADSQMGNIRKLIKSERSAGWWMEHRSEYMENEFIDNYKHQACKKKKAENKLSFDAKQHEKHLLESEIKSNIISNDSSIRNVIFISMESQTIRLYSLKEWDSNDIKFLNDYGVEINDTFCIRSVSEYDGDIIDVAAYIGNYFYQHNCGVSVFDNTVRKKIAENDFRVPGNKWIKKYDESHAYIQVPDNDKCVANRALAFISGAYKAERKIVFPVIEKESIKRFAKNNEYKIDREVSGML